MSSTTTAALAATSGDERIPRKEASDGLSVSDHCAPMPGEPTTDTEVNACRTHRLLWQPQSASRKRLNESLMIRPGLMGAGPVRSGTGCSMTQLGIVPPVLDGHYYGDGLQGNVGTGQVSRFDSCPLHPAKSVQEVAGLRGSEYDKQTSLISSSGRLEKATATVIKVTRLKALSFHQRRPNQPPICTPIAREVRG